MQYCCHFLIGKVANTVQESLHSKEHYQKDGMISEKIKIESTISPGHQSYCGDCPENPGRMVYLRTDLVWIAILLKFSSIEKHRSLLYCAMYLTSLLVAQSTPCRAVLWLVNQLQIHKWKSSWRILGRPTSQTLAFNKTANNLRKIGVRTEIWTRCLRNIKQEYYLISQVWHR